MSSNSIPSSVDCIILGTGLTNSIVAAACSRIGKTVLHLDKNGYYGDQWASFTFQQLIDWIKLNHPNASQTMNVEVPQELLDKSRMFCLDLCPRLLFSTGAMVELLVKSNVSRYHEFKNNIRILSMVDTGEIHVIPCRRSEVFNSPLLADLIDKRRLMKFVEQCIKYEPEQESSDSSSPVAKNAEKPILEYLESQGLNNRLKQYIINSIAMVEPTETTRKACENIKKFMFSTERFGKSPFLFPLYGCGEFPQSFCRLSAVFGGIYCLNTQIDLVQELGEAREAGDASISQKERFSVKFANEEHEVKSYQLVQDHKAAFKLSRAILITNKSLVQNDEKLLSFLRIPPKGGDAGSNENVISVLELNASVMVCPPDLNIVYMWTRASSSQTSDCAGHDLRPTAEKVLDKESILWSFYYNQEATIDLIDDLDYTTCIQEAKRIFTDMYPDEEFLPRAPDPDEIIT